VTASPVICLAAVLAAGPPGPRSEGWKRELSGSLGHGLEVRVSLQKTAGAPPTLFGSYVYAKKGRPLRLAGQLDADDTFHLAEGPQGAQSTGSWDGRLVEDGSLIGIWRDRDKTRALPFELHPVEVVTAAPPGSGQAEVRHRYVLLSRREDGRENCPRCHVWIFYPEVKNISDPRLAAKVGRAIGVKRGFGQSLDQLQADFRQDEGDWEPFDFTVTFNRAGLLSLEFRQEVSEAYPVSTSTPVAVDLETGEPLKVSDVLTPEGIRWALDRLNNQLAAAKVDALREIKADDAKEGSRSDPETLKRIRNARFSTVDLKRSLSLTEAGLAFSHPIELPNAIRAEAPASDVVIPWKDLAGHLTESFAQRLH